MLDDGGRYDFNYSLDFAQQEVMVNFSNYSSPTLGLSSTAPKRQFMPIDAGPGDFAIYEFQDMVNSPASACTPCDESITLMFFDSASPPRRATHKVVLQTPGLPEVTGVGETPLGQLSPRTD